VAFFYIVAVNLGACFGWGLIDGLIYAVSSSIERNNIRNKLLRLRDCSVHKVSLDAAVKQFDGTFLEGFTVEGKKAIAKDVITYVQEADLGKSKVLTRDEFMGGLSILGIYLTVGFLMALPFLVLQDKFMAWLISNSLGVAWVLHGMECSLVKP